MWNILTFSSITFISRMVVGKIDVCPKNAVLRKALEETDELHKVVKVIIAGDFNAAHREIDLEHPAANSKTTRLLAKNVPGLTSIWNITLWTLRQLYRDRGYTWWSYRTAARLRNVGWRWDYYLISKSLCRVCRM